MANTDGKETSILSRRTSRGRLGRGRIKIGNPTVWSPTKPTTLNTIAYLARKADLTTHLIRIRASLQRQHPKKYQKHRKTTM